MATSSPVDRARRLLEHYLEERELEVEDLARGLGCSAGEVKERLSGGRLLGLDWLDAALAVLDVSPAEFFSRLYQEPTEAGAGTEDPERRVSGRRERNGPGPGGNPGSDAPGSGDPPPAEAVDEVLSREEVEALIAEARALIRGSSRMIDARQQADHQQADDPATEDESEAPPDLSRA